jgi:hypothetical protein
LLSARLSSGQADSALAALQALNPHADFKKLRAGTVLLVPDAPSFKASASDSVAGETFDGFQQLVRSALGSATENLKAGNLERAGERDEVIEVTKRAAVKRIIDADAELKQQVTDATKAFKEDQQQAEQAEQDLAAASKAALAKLAELKKLLG